MLFAHWMLLVASLLPIVAVGFAKSRGGKYDNHNPREFLEKLREGSFAKRMAAAQANSWEALGMFAPAVLLATIRLEAAVEHAPAAEQWNYGLLIATFIDVAVDGFIIGAGFAADSNTGLILALGLSVELLFLGLSLVSDTIKGWRVALMSGLLGAVVLGCTLLGHFLLSGASHNLISAMLAFGVAVLLYLVTDELLIEAHEVEEKPISTLWLFAGFLAFWSIQLMNAA
jgi:ZIP family zinc transporter